jgi:hypothetical protein
LLGLSPGSKRKETHNKQRGIGAVGMGRLDEIERKNVMKAFKCPDYVSVDPHESRLNRGGILVFRLQQELSDGERSNVRQIFTEKKKKIGCRDH